MTRIVLLFALFSALHLFGQDTLNVYSPSTGVLISKEIKNVNGNIVSRMYFYETGESKGEAFYDERGVLLDAYTLAINGDTTFKSHIPDFNKQPAKDLSSIIWRRNKDGIAYSVTRKGEGKKLKDGDAIDVWYIGYFTNGKQFENSDITGNLLKLRLGNKGFMESFQNALKKFRIGGEGYIKIPPRLGYGASIHGNIPAHSTLIYYIKISKPKV